MPIDENGLRKVAIVVSNLDRDSADLVLDRLPADEAERVRHTILSLESIDPKEQRRVIDEFLQSSPRIQHSKTDDSQVTFARVPGRGKGDAASDSQSRLFKSLTDMQPEGLAGILAGERPQTIALVLSHLPPELSGQVLVQIPPHVQPEVFRRLVDLEETDPEILAEIEESLQARLNQAFALPRKRVAGLSAVEGILGASDRGTGTQLYRNLSSQDQQLASQLQPEPLEFEDLERVDYADLQELLDAVESSLLSLALVGASPTLVHRVSAALPASRAAVLRHEMNHPAPTRLSDVEGARQRIGLIAQKIGIRSPRSASGPAPRSPAANTQLPT